MSKWGMTVQLYSSLVYFGTSTLAPFIAIARVDKVARVDYSNSSSTPSRLLRHLE